MLYPCLEISFGVGQVLEHIRALSVTSCCDLRFARSWEAHGADLDSLPSFLVTFPCSSSDFDDCGLVMLLITFRCPLAHPAAFGRQPVHFSFSKLWSKETEERLSLLFLLFYRNQGFAFDYYKFSLVCSSSEGSVLPLICRDQGLCIHLSCQTFLSSLLATSFLCLKVGISLLSSKCDRFCAIVLNVLRLSSASYHPRNILGEVTSWTPLVLLDFYQMVGLMWSS